MSLTETKLAYQPMEPVKAPVAVSIKAARVVSSSSSLVEHLQSMDKVNSEIRELETALRIARLDMQYSKHQLIRLLVEQDRLDCLSINPQAIKNLTRELL